MVICLFTSLCDRNRFTWIHLISVLSVSYLPPTINDTAECLYAALLSDSCPITRADRYWFLLKDLKIPKLVWEFIKPSTVISDELFLSSTPKLLLISGFKCCFNTYADGQLRLKKSLLKEKLSWSAVDRNSLGSQFWICTKRMRN